MINTPHSPTPSLVATGTTLVLGWLRHHALLVVSLVLLAAFSTVNSNVLSIENLRNILVQSSYLMIFAAAQMIVILTRGFDLSLGATVSLVSVVSSMAMVSLGTDSTTLQLAVGLLVAILVSASVGCVNGFAVAVLGVNPFVVTLATWNIVLTLASTVSNGFPIDGLPVAFGDWFARGAPFGLPIPLLITLAILLALAWMLLRTTFGRRLFLVGANPQAAKLGGTRNGWVLFWAYITCSILVAIGAFLLTARMGSGEPNLGGSLTMDSIAAAVIGGVSLRGGEGRISSPIIGAVFVTVLSNGMNLLRVDGSVQQITLGLVIIVALLVDRLRGSTRLV